MALEVSANQPTKFILADILQGFQMQERIKVKVLPEDADSLITRVRMMKSRALSRIEKRGKRRQHFLLRSEKVNWTDSNGKRWVMVIFWKDVRETQKLRQEIEGMLAQ